MVKRSLLPPLLLAAACVLVTVPSSDAQAEEEKPILVDRVVARWRLSDGGDGPTGERLIFARLLALEARIEGMALGEAPDAPVVDRHIRLALARHVTEELLEGLPVDPEPTPAEVAKRADASKEALEARVRGAENLERAMAIERVSADELRAILRRSARASFYLERMVAPIVEPSELELRELHATGKTPFSDKPFEPNVAAIRRAVIAERLAAALDDFWQQARSRLVIKWLKPHRSRRRAR